MENKIFDVEIFEKSVDWNSIICEDISTLGETVDGRENFNIILHCHDKYELAYFDNGGSVETVEGAIVQNFYNCIIYPPNFMHKETLDIVKAKKTVFMLFDMKTNLKFNQPIQVKDLNGKLYWLLNEIYKSKISSYQFENQMLANTYLKAILLNMCSKKFHENEANTIIMRCVNYMNIHYDEHITLDDLVSFCYVSASYLNRVFKKATGVAPMKYLNLIRIDHSKLYLCETKFSIDEISLKTGFLDVKYFSRVFKKITGQIPSDFRKNVNK